jgi:hypothetical protein
VLLLEGAFREIDDTLGTEGADGIPRLDFANRAGALLYAESWGWLERKEWTLTIGAGATYVTLPPDCASVRTVVAASGSVAYIANYVAFVERKTRGNASCTLLSPYFEADADGRPIARLAVYPSPSAAITVKAAGRMRWPGLTGEVGERDAIPLPPALPIFESLYLEFLRAVALGHTRVDSRTRQGELALVYAGPVYAKAKSEDARLFPRLGGVRNTAIDVARQARRPGMSDVIWSEPPTVDLG